MKEKEIDINEVSISIDVNADVIEEIRTGETSHIALPIDEDNQNLLLENIDGNLILSTDEMPMNFCGCFLYNNGTFPYVVKQTLKFLVLVNGEDSCLVRIESIFPHASTRFRFQNEGEPGEEDPNGDCCIWHIVFDVEPVSKPYLLRWNPAISSFTEDDYKYCVENAQDGTFRLNWSVYEWQQVAYNDTFYMMRVGDDKAGIAFHGQFTSAPYTGDDWAGTKHKRHYVDLICTPLAAPGEVPLISLEKLQGTIPEIDWGKGRSGVLLPKSVADKLDKLIEGNTK